MAPSDPQDGQPEHLEYPRVSYPHRCHWIVIMKAIVQCSIISGLPSLVTEPGPMQGHEGLGTSETWATSITDRLPFSEILQAVIEEHDRREYQVLAALYPSMITARDLVREVETLSAQARERSEKYIANGVYQFMRVWVLNGYLEESFLSEMRLFPDDRIKNLIDHPSRPAARPFSPGSTNSLASYSTTSNGGGKPRGKPRKPKKVRHNVASMRSREIEDLSQALCNLEFENYADLTLQSAIQTLATWRDNQQVSLFLPFAEKVGSLWFLTPQHS